MIIAGRVKENKKSFFIHVVFLLRNKDFIQNVSLLWYRDTLFQALDLKHR